LNKFDFDKIVYHKPFPRLSDKYLTEFTGLDTETYISGKPFLFCFSDGTILFYEDIPDKLFTREYRDTHFVVWNLKFDSGSLIYHLPKQNKVELKQLQKTYYNGYKYEYIPHKRLRICRGSKGVTFWDIMQFFGMSLQRASLEYLNESKLDIETKEFTLDYVSKNIDSISQYCIRDSYLTKQLIDYLLKYIRKFEILPNNLYSPASLSFTYFKKHSRIVDIWYYWKYHKESVKFGCNSYYGGKFEVTARGKFYGYEYDINSAYPYEIANLIDISDGVCKQSKEYIKDAVYGFLYCDVNIPDNLHHSITIKDLNINYYPCGKFRCYITKQEYDWLVERGVKVKILDGYWIIVFDIKYPYRQLVNKLYRIKEEYKIKDKTISRLAKLMLNSFYGKMCQLIEKPDGSLQAGSGWNIFYASIITANVRLRVSDIQNLLLQDCLAVHTDSVITTKKIPDNLLSQGLGAWELKKEGAGVILMSGVYEIGNKVANRGFPVDSSFTWSDILKRIGNESVYKFSNRICRSWIHAVELDREFEINKFLDEVKELDLNIDHKRVWLSKTTGNKLLQGLEQSIPKIYFD